MSRIFALGTLIVGGLIMADFLAHYKVTTALINAGTTESKYVAGR